MSQKRAVEHDNGVQMDLFTKTGQFPRELEVLRMEVRLGSHARIVKLLKQIDVLVEPTFAALFDQSIAKAVLLHFWDSVKRQLPLAGRGKRKCIPSCWSSRRRLSETCVDRSSNASRRANSEQYAIKYRPEF